MKLSIVTINYNNVAGLQKTMESVLNQTSRDFEYIVVDGGSTDNSNVIIGQYANMPIKCKFNWVSEPDSGIYNAMNKGINMAKGEYVQFLNSGDILVEANVTERMLQNMPECDIMYGNMLKSLSKGIYRDKGPAGRIPTMFDFYRATLNHSPSYIKRSLFEKFGLYDESLKIVSDWKWYLEVIGLNNIIPVYKDIDVTNFDMTGISSTNTRLEKAERRKVLEEVLPLSVLVDYDRYAFSIEQMNRINRYWLLKKLIWFLERTLFIFEKFKLHMNER